MSFNVEFFTHRMESDNSAKFAAEHAERFIATPVEVTLADAGPTKVG